MSLLNVPEDRLSSTPGTAEILIVCVEPLISLHSQLLMEISQDIARYIIRHCVKKESQETCSLLFWGHYVTGCVFQSQDMVLSLTKLGSGC